MASKLIPCRFFSSKVSESGKPKREKTGKQVKKTDPETDEKQDPGKTDQEELNANIVIPEEFSEEVSEVTISCRKLKIHGGKYVPYQVNVSLQGVHCRAGKIASLLLTHNPLIKRLALYDRKHTDYLADDLNDIDKTTTLVKSYHGEEGFENAFSAADIAVLIDTDKKHEIMEKKLEISFPRVKEFAEKCSIYCPRAVLIICVDPLCCTIPIIQRVFDDSPWFHPGKLLGNVFPVQCALNSIAGRYLNLHPSTVHIPIIGGPDAHSVVPLVSQMTPDPGLNSQDQIKFYEMIKSELLSDYQDLNHVPSTMSEGFSIAKMVSTVAKGLCGEEDINASAFIRTNLAPQVNYLVSTIKMGGNGICHNYGMPKLSPFESEQLLCAMNSINDHQHVYERMWEKEIMRTKITCPPR